MNKVNKYPDIEKLSFEKAMEELEIIVSDLENGSIELEESIEKYQRVEMLNNNRIIVNRIINFAEKLINLNIKLFY